MNGTSWLLGSGNPWRSADPGAVVANQHSGMSLASLATGQLGLASPDGSLGQLTLPSGVALDGEALFVLSQDGSLVYHYDAVHQALVPLAHVGAQGLCGPQDQAVFREARRFHHASAIAALHGALYVADPRARRVQVFDWRTLALLRIIDGIGTPADLAAGADALYILDGASGRVYRAAPGSDALTLAVEAPPAAPGHREGGAAPPDRIAVDRAGQLYLRRQHCGQAELELVDVGGKLPVRCPRERITDSAQVRERFAPPLVTMDGCGVLALAERLRDPCGLRRPIAAGAPRWRVAGRLYVADPASRTLRVLLDDGRMRHQFGPLDAGAGEVAADSDQAWSPADVVALGGAVVILDERHQRIYSHRTGDAALRLRFGAPAGFEREWHRIAADQGGALLLWDGSGDLVDRFSPKGQARGVVPLRSVRQFFTRAPLPASDRPGVLLTCSGVRPRHGRPQPVWPPARFRQHGIWTSQWLDSEIHDCHWHLIELSVGRMPPGAGIRLRSRTSNEEQDPGSAAAGLPGSWDDMPPYIAAAQPAPGAATGFDSDLLVLSAPGRYLQLQVELTGDGTDSPLLNHVRIRFPRESLLDYLPALYSTAPEQQEFLDRFLSIVQTTWSRIEREVDTFQRYLDPDSVPPASLAYLADWLDVKLEGTWRPEQNRRLLQAMPRLRPKWGTVDGLREWVRIYLANLADVDERALEQLGVPAIVERFVERRQLLLGDASAALGTAQALWSPAVERRFQVGVFDRLGDVELVSTGDPQADALRHYAHAFRVYVPAQLVRTPADEAMLRRAIETQKPAHASYQLVLVEPRLRIGVQSTIGLDTVIGGPAAGPLPCPARLDAPSRAPYQRLGFDTILGPVSEGDSRSRLTRVLA
ncbi:phage tail protein [Massilia antarctica]|uniref:phage tail protein n=1 Tax=Massilia antarctica TaxID=2765360 RepID=UPI0006BB54AE|nr:phage tail protein [Massilia sp. H27-R4]MCY0916458.1 phage tail protein [Massilia sp. H27-R4]CUI07389.1 NHL repeat domain protein [Janthinobacterium sp. CG23_2]CUU31175.1 NHL repeat domain protein [Janthinobacterium sp. CG23_2]